MAKNGLDASNYRGWIDKTIEFSHDLSILFSEFVVGTPAYGLSAKGRSLHDYYNYDSISDYDQLKKEMLSSVDFQPFEKYEELKKALINHNILSFSNKVPLTTDEYVYIYVGTVSDSKFYQAYFKGETNINKGKKNEIRQQEALQRRITVAVDKLFYHLRNALAHGYFVRFDQDDTKMIVLQDESNDGSISARMVLKMDTLKEWIEYLKMRKTAINNNKNTGENNHEPTNR